MPDEPLPLNLLLSLSGRRRNGILWLFEDRKTAAHFLSAAVFFSNFKIFKDMNRSITCSHGRKRWIQCPICNECPGRHGKTLIHCAICHGCPHNKRKDHCRICSGCLHGKRKDKCSVCKKFTRELVCLQSSSVQAGEAAACPRSSVAQGPEEAAALPRQLAAADFSP